MGNANSSTKIANRLDKRKCLFGCGGDMSLVMLVPGGMHWSCPKCQKVTPKLKGDYTKADRDIDYPKEKK